MSDPSDTNHASTAALSRNVEAVRIPSGESLNLPSGTTVVVTQALGGSFTILVPSQAGLFRIAGQDADALGLEPPAESSGGGSSSMEESVWEALKTCYDPEIPVNIVDLGLIYGLTIDESGAESAADAGGATVHVNMTLTAPGCGMGPVIASEAKQKIESLDGVREATVDLVWEPAWGPERITPDGRMKLGME